MSDQIKKPFMETKKIVVLKFRARVARPSRQAFEATNSRFADVDQVLDDIFQKDQIRCA